MTLYRPVPAVRTTGYRVKGGAPSQARPSVLQQWLPGTKPQGPAHTGFALLGEKDPYGSGNSGPSDRVRLTNQVSEMTRMQSKARVI